METSIAFMLLLQAVLIMLNAVFASAEIAVLSVSETKLNKLASEGNRRAGRLGRLMEQPAKFLATIQVAITLSGFLGSAFAADNFSDGIVNWLVGLGVTIPRSTLDTLAVIFITLVLSYFTLVFGELVPKRIAMKKPEKLALGMSGLIGLISKLFAPVVWLLTVSTNGVLRLMGIDPEQEEEQYGEADIRMMVDASSKKGGIDHEEKEFIQNVFEFDDLNAGEIATHRTDVDMLWLDEPMDTWAATIHGTRHTLYPVCKDSPDNIVGILNAKDYFRLDDRARGSVMTGAVKLPYFVPKTLKADVLFRNMKRSRNAMAVVLDEYGGMVGIVTINDLVEQLVGELRDDESGEANEPGIKKLDDSHWAVRGNVELTQLQAELGVKLDAGDYDTFTGLVFDVLGYIPEDGERDIDLQCGDLSIHVSQVHEHQVSRARIELPEGRA